MRSLPRGGVAIGAAGAAALLLEAMSLSSGAGMALAFAGFVVLVGGLVIARANLQTAAIGTVCLAAFTSPWNGWSVGSLQPGDLLFMLALILFAAHGIRGAIPRMPPRVVLLSSVILLVAVLHELVPVSDIYLANRVVVGADGIPTAEFQVNMFVAFKFLVGVLAIPFAFCFAVDRDRRAIRWLALSFVGGVAVSGLVAFTDSKGLTSLSVQITGIDFTSTREGGLTKHPNFLAASCVVAIPLSVWMMAARRRLDQVAGLVGFVCIALGAYSTGSRGGTVAVVIAIGLSLVLTPRLRPYLSFVALAAGIVVVGAFVLFPRFGAALLKATRLGGDTNDTAGSNAVRAIVGKQGLDDFRHSPIYGIGLQVADQAQNVYVQELASGGLLLFGAMLIYTLGSFRAAAMLQAHSDMAGALLASAMAAAAFNYVEADLTDRFFYVPSGILVALCYARSRQVAPDPPPAAALDGDVSRRSDAAPVPRPV